MAHFGYAAAAIQHTATPGHHQSLNDNTDPVQRPAAAASIGAELGTRREDAALRDLLAALRVGVGSGPASAATPPQQRPRPLGELRQLASEAGRAQAAARERGAARAQLSTLVAALKQQHQPSSAVRQQGEPSRTPAGDSSGGSGIPAAAARTGVQREAGRLAAAVEELQQELAAAARQQAAAAGRLQAAERDKGELLTCVKELARLLLLMRPLRPLGRTMGEQWRLQAELALRDRCVFA
jgi:hypothetical protein